MIQGTFETAPNDAEGEPRSVSHRLRSDRGAGLVEYALLLALIAIVCISALVFFGSNSQNSVTHSKDCIVNAGTPSQPANC